MDVNKGNISKNRSLLSGFSRAGLLLGLLLLAPGALAFDLAIGLAGVEEGYDRARPAIGLRVGVGDAWVAEGLYWGRTFGPVREKSILIDVARRFPVAHSEWLYGSFGLSALQEATKIKGVGSDGATVNEESGGSSSDVFSENSHALGVGLGLGARLFTLGPCRYDFLWTSHVFPAGVFGGLFLAHGRKQSFMIAGGVEL